MDNRGIRRWLAQRCGLICLSITLTALGLASSNWAMAADTDSLAELRWEHRIILGSVSEPGPSLDVLAAQDPELRDRDLLYFLLSDEGPLTNASRGLSPEFWQEVEGLVPDGGFVLIGRDGGVKARYRSLDLEKMFALIDTMPMRIQEMRARGEER